jgi:O-antigen/teichoic acid export membrane protein
MLSGAVQTIAMPAIARESTVEGRHKACERVFSRYWLVSILIMLTLSVVAPFVIPCMYG